MLTSTSRTATALLLMTSLAWIEPVTANGQPIKVEQAIPSEAEQGQKGLSVKIKGRNFGPGSEVRFLVAGTEDDTQIDVLSVVYDEGSGDLDTVIDVDDAATISGYDIEVRRSGRGGKGTDLFRVRPGDSRIATLDILYEFGELSAGACVAPECVSTTFTATGTIECTNLYCLFHSSSVVADFHLPSGLRNLLFATEWRRTPLDPDQCFGSSPADPGGGTALIDHTQLELRRYHDDTTPWFAQLHALSLDTAGLEVRNYTFNFEGCGETSCGVSTPNSTDGVYEGGKLIRIDGKGPDRKFLSVPCRCTISNTPDCPDDVPEPTPPIRITAIEVS